MFDVRVRQEKLEIEFVTKSREKVSVDREKNSFPRTGKLRRRREVRFIPAPLDSRRYSASGTAAREHCYIVLRATIKAESRTRKDDEEEEEEKGGETAMVFHHTVSFFLPFFLLLF